MEFLGRLLDGPAYAGGCSQRHVQVGGGVLIIMHGRSRMTIDSLHPYKAGTEHVGFSPTRKADIAINSAKRREMFGESHEG